MLAMLRDLIAHNGHANAGLLAAVRQLPAATADSDLVALLHHVLLANRFWLTAVLGTPFDLEQESRPSATFDALVGRYASTHDQQMAWVAAATDADLARVLEHAHIPGGRCSVAQALVQVCMHSHGHRAQGAKLLRHHSGTPPVLDFIAWLASRPAPEWALG